MNKKFTLKMDLFVSSNHTRAIFWWKFCYKCSRLFELDPWDTRQNALYNIDPVQTREWARKITKGPLNPLLTDFQKLDRSLATHMTKPSYDAQTPFRRERPKLETQATERLYKDAPPGILMIILYRIYQRQHLQ